MLSTQTGTQGDLPPAQPSDEKAEVKVTSVDDKSPSQTLPSQTHPQEPLLSFAADFWDKPELVVKGYMSRIATLDGFIDYFTSRATIEANYGNALMKTLRKTDLLSVESQSSTLRHAIESYITTNEVASANCQAVSAKITSLVEKLTAARTRDVTFCKKALASIDGTRRRVKDAVSTVKSCKEKAEKACTVARQAREHVRQAGRRHVKGAGVSIEQLTNITRQSLNADMKAKKACDVYRQSIDDLAVSLREHEDNSAVINSKVQSMEMARVTLLSKAMQLQSSLLISVHKQAERQQEVLLESLNAIVPESDVRLIASSLPSSTDKMKPTPPIYSHPPGHPDLTDELPREQDETDSAASSLVTGIVQSLQSQSSTSPTSSSSPSTGESSSPSPTASTPASTYSLFSSALNVIAQALDAAVDDEEDDDNDGGAIPIKVRRTSRIQETTTSSTSTPSPSITDQASSSSSSTISVAPRARASSASRPPSVDTSAVSSHHSKVASNHEGRGQQPRRLPHQTHESSGGSSLFSSLMSSVSAAASKAGQWMEDNIGIEPLDDGGATPPGHHLPTSTTNGPGVMHPTPSTTATHAIEEHKSPVRIQAEKDLGRIIDGLLLDGSISEEDQQIANLAFLCNDGRKAFAFVVNKLRNSRNVKLTPPVYDVMTKLVSTFLDQAYAAGDVRPTQLVMIMTQTLYKEIPKERKEPLSTPASTLTSTSSSSSSSSTTESPIARPPSAMSDTSSVTSVTSTTGTSNPLTKVSTTGSESGGRMRKVYLQAAVRDHQVWKDLRYWEEAFFDALTVALIRQGSVAQLTPSHGTDSFSSFTAHALAHALGVSSSSNDDDATTAEQEHVRREATFATLTTFLSNMGDFGVPPVDISKFAKRMADINDLSADHRAMLDRLTGVYTPSSLSSSSSTTSTDDTLRAQDDTDSHKSPTKPTIKRTSTEPGKSAVSITSSDASPRPHPTQSTQSSSSPRKTIADPLSIPTASSKRPSPMTEAKTTSSDADHSSSIPTTSTVPNPTLPTPQQPNSTQSSLSHPLSMQTSSIPSHPAQSLPRPPVTRNQAILTSHPRQTPSAVSPSSAPQPTANNHSVSTSHPSSSTSASNSHGTRPLPPSPLSSPISRGSRNGDDDWEVI